MYKWYLPTLSEILAPAQALQALQEQSGSAAQQRLRAEREWCGAIAALNILLSQLLQKSDQALQKSDLEAQQTCQPLFHGVVLAGPVPVLEAPELVAQLSTWTFTINPLGAATWMPFQLLPADAQQVFAQTSGSVNLSLMPNDPLAAEQFCVVLTPDFGLIMVLGEDELGDPAFMFSFEPEQMGQVWQALRGRLMFTNPEHLQELDYLLKKFAPPEPDYRLVTQFTRSMLNHLPQPIEWEVASSMQGVSQGNGYARPVGLSEAVEVQSTQVSVPSVAPVSVKKPAKVNRGNGQGNGWRSPALHPLSFLSQDAGSGGQSATNPVANSRAGQNGKVKPPFVEKGAKPVDPVESDEADVFASESFDKELLQAIAHEVRTPLTTIRTLTRLLLKRKDLSPDVLKRLDSIDRECSEQIDRFNLFFRAVEVEKAPVKQPLTPLTPISLSQLFQQNVPKWQQQASQRNLTLDVSLPQKLPLVVADPAMLNQVLTGLIDRITHTLAPGSHIKVGATLAGHQLKLQFESQPPASETPEESGFLSPLKALGQLLMFQPETGNLSLNLSVTKNLFQALGGKMTVKQKPQQGEVLTIFLPLETRRSEE